MPVDKSLSLIQISLEIDSAHKSFLELISNQISGKFEIHKHIQFHYRNPSDTPKDQWTKS